jgi:uncharacterized lipoprotein YbaY
MANLNLSWFKFPLRILALFRCSFVQIPLQDVSVAVCGDCPGPALAAATGRDCGTALLPFKFRKSDENVALSAK